MVTYTTDRPIGDTVAPAGVMDWDTLDTVPDHSIIGMTARQGSDAGQLIDAGRVVGVERDARNGSAIALHIERTHVYRHQGVEVERYTERGVIRRGWYPVAVD